LPTVKTCFKYMQAMWVPDASQSIPQKFALPVKQMGRYER